MSQSLVLWNFQHDAKIELALKIQFDKWSLRTTLWTWSLHFFWKSFLISMHSHLKGKTKFIQLCLFQRHGHVFWVLKHFHLKFHMPIGMLPLIKRNLFSNFVKFLWLYMSIYLFYSCRLYLIPLGGMNKALAWRLYWMTELPKCGSVRIDRYSKCKILWLKPKKWIWWNLNWGVFC